MKKEKIEKRLQRKRRVRAKILGTSDRPRLNVFRSSKHVFAQIIDDTKGMTLVSMSDLTDKTENEKKDEKDKTKKQLAFTVGEALAKRAIAKKIRKVIFDKGGYKYHGRVMEVAQGARKGGLEF